MGKNTELLARSATRAADHHNLVTDIFVPTPDKAVPEFSIFEPKITSPVMAAIAGRDVATILNWRRKYRLMGWSPHQLRGSSVKWSVIDCMMTRLAVVMIDNGIDPKAAAWFVGAQKTPKEVAMGTVLKFGTLLTNTHAQSLVAFHGDGTAKHPNDLVSFHALNPTERVSDLVARLKKVANRDSFVILDLRDIIQRVKDGLGIEIFAREAR